MKLFGSSSSNAEDDHRALERIVDGCEASNHTYYMSHSADTWILLQKAHDRVKGKIHDNKFSHSGMKIPFVVEVNPATGLRQIKTTRDVPKGTAVWEPLHYETFRSEHAYAAFLEELPHSYLRCEVLSWTHASWMVEDHVNHPYVDVTLDEGAFIKESSDPLKVNIDDHCVSLRDIRAGEFIAISPYIAYDAVTWLEDLRSIAWTNQTGTSIGGDHTSPGIARGVVVLTALCALVKVLLRRGRSISTYYPTKDSLLPRSYESQKQPGMAYFFSAAKSKLH